MGAVYVAPNHLTLQELFSRIHAGKLFLFGFFFKTLCTFQEPQGRGSLAF